MGKSRSNSTSAVRHKKKSKQAPEPASEDKGITELERKYVFHDATAAYALFPEADTPRDCYRAGFEAIAEDLQRFPDLSVLFGHSARRSIDRKDLRQRIYLADANFKLIDDDWELRLEIGNRRLMVKKGKPANDNNPTLDRVEHKITMTIPRIGSIGDVTENSNKNKSLPEGLRALFGKKADKEELYPVVPTQSWRDKFVYYKSVTYDDRQFLIGFEFAQDEGEARPLGGEPYALDQFELEVKDVIDVRTGASVMNDPSIANMSEDELHSGLIAPAFEEEDTYLCDRLGLEHVYESKPQQGFKQARAFMNTKDGLAAAKAARKEHLTSSPFEHAGIVLETLA